VVLAFILSILFIDVRILPFPSHEGDHLELKNEAHLMGRGLPALGRSQEILFSKQVAWRQAFLSHS
ncbi:MAG TPA: hypothetical protein VFC46_00950, partial [Humisphaera sp.]|nr:hypothetical protein [Humisphaera sp.]